MFITIGHKLINADRITLATYHPKGPHGSVVGDQSRLRIEFGEAFHDMEGDEADQAWQALRALATDGEQPRPGT
jgi:hypothetical protein